MENSNPSYHHIAPTSESYPQILAKSEPGNADSGDAISEIHFRFRGARIRGGGGHLKEGELLLEVYRSCLLSYLQNLRYSDLASERFQET